MTLRDRPAFRRAQRCGVLAAAIGLVLVALPAAASAAHQMTLSNGAPIHWKSNSPSTALRSISVFDNLTNSTAGQRWRSFLSTDRANWDNAMYLTLTAAGALSSDSYNCPISTKGVVVCNWNNYNGLGNGGDLYAGLAEYVVIYSTGHVSSVRARLDDENSGMNYAGQTCVETGNVAGPCQVAAHSAQCQELGHAWGLDHIAGDTCMGAGYFASSAFQVAPNAHDYDRIRATHAHIDGGATAASLSAARVRAAQAVDHGQDRTAIDPPPPGDCRRKKVKENLFVERVCGPEAKGSADLIRIIDVLPPKTTAGASGP